MQGMSNGLLKILLDSLPVGGAFETPIKHITVSPETPVNKAALHS